MLRLQGRIQHYDWGSKSALPAFTNSSPDGRPWAEIWYGAHHRAPSLVSDLSPWVDGSTPAQRRPPQHLDEYLQSRSNAANRGSGESTPLPFLAKLLSAEKALSLQVHPNLEAARKGYADQQALGISETDGVYADAMHKPETLVSLVPTDALAGFREPAAIADDLRRLNSPVLEPIIQMLEEDAGTGLRRAFAATLQMEPRQLEQVLQQVKMANSQTQEPLSHAICVENGSDGRVSSASADKETDAWLRAGRPSKAGELAPSPCSQEEPGRSGTYTVLDNLEVAGQLLTQYPGDAGVLGSFFLNAIRLDPWQALSINAGVVHGYLAGGGLEVMANSDNVLRAGLTHKLVALNELLEVVDFRPTLPLVDAPMLSTGGSPRRGWRALEYPAHFSEFAITCFQVLGYPGELEVGGPSEGVLLGLSGSVIAESASGRVCLAPGDAVFLEAGEKAFLQAENGIAAYIRPNLLPH